MGKFTLSHEINQSVDAFWQTFFQKDFHEKMIKEGLKFDYQLISQSETETEHLRTYSTTPRIDLPGPIAKLLGANFRIEERGRFDKKTRVYAFKMTPSALADKYRNEGTLRLEPIGENKVRRVAEIFVEAKIFGLGGLIESTAERQTRDAWDKSAAFHNKWIATHPT